MEFIAMNRFKIALNRESDFENIWKKRETHLSNVPGSDSNISISSTEYEFAPTSDLQTNDIERIFCSYKIGQAQYSFAHE